ncbi:MBL fold metallo-hydrolase [Fodinicurvata sp. EGI_FJ10296]|uniref:MBL fold metallo-hydrolase n=1 Tax=Fodinicurvata sp. EGI_FJ10296 TaxID=3231908 RepID=UPI003454C77D
MPRDPGIYPRRTGVRPGNGVRRLLVASTVLLWAGSVQADLDVHFIDVGQGDAVLLATADARILVDGGGAGGQVSDYLAALGVTDLDLVVATHAHADHIGGLTDLLQAGDIAVDALWYNGQTHTTVTFETFIDAIAAAPGIDYREPVRGDRVSIDGIGVSVLHPATSAADATGDLHDSMIILRADYGQTSVLLTGDAEVALEASLLETGISVHADILKLGHHGSSTSTSVAFLEAVSPEIAVYQAAADNRYGHPDDAVLARLAAADIAVYGTDTHGTVVARSDGKNWAVPDIDGAPLMAAAACVDLNAATPDRLAEIVHIGPARAEAVAAARPFGSIDELGRVPGIGPARLADIAAQGLACGP